MTLDAVIRDARLKLSAALSLEPKIAALEAQILLAHTLKTSRTYLLTHPELKLDPANTTTFTALLKRRLEGEPIAYLIEQREFFGLALRVTPAVLIPRSDTELLVELALAMIPQNARTTVLDLGTGSGAIAIAIAKMRPMSLVTAIDQSAEALAIAKENVHQHKVTNLQLLLGSWFTPLETNTRFDVIVGNPPYIAENDSHLSQGDLRFEPAAALTSGADGLDAIRTIACKAAQHLTAAGWLLLEHGFEQGAACRKILFNFGFQSICSHRDLAGQEDFAKKWDEALKEGVECMEAEAHRRGFEGNDKPLIHQGEFTYLRDFDAIDPLTDEKYPPHQAPIKLDKNGQPIVATMKEYSDTLCIFLLKAHAPEKFRERVDLSVSNGDVAKRLIEARARAGGG